MKLEITDISYITALTYELVDRYGFQTLGAPTYPSLRKEAIYRTDPGRPAVPLFLQYKLGEYIVGAAASLKDFWGIPYYRFLIQPRNKYSHHELLQNLESMDYLVYYTAPEIHTISEFYNCLTQQAMLDNSSFWSPQVIGELSGNQRHRLCHKHDAQIGILEPGNRKIPHAIKGEMLLDEIKDKFEANRFEDFDNDRLIRLGDQMLENYLEVFHKPRERRLIEDIRQGRERIDARDYLSLISILLYECYVYMIGI